MIKKWLLNSEILDFLSKSKWTASSNIIISGFGLIATILLTHLLSVSEFGQYKFFLSILGLVSIASLPGINNAILRYAALNQKEVFIQGSLIKFLFSLSGSAIIIILGVYMLIRSDSTWPIYFIAAPLFPFIFSFDGIIFFLYGTGEFKQAAFLKTIINIIPYSLIILASIVSKNIIFILSIYLFSLASLYLIIGFKFWKKYGIKKPSHEFVTFGKHLSILSILSTGFSYMDKILMTYFFGYSAVGLFATAEIIPNQFKTQSKITFAWLLPKLTSKKQLKFSTLIPYILIILTGSFFICLTIALLVGPIIKLVFPNDYASSIKMAQLLMISCIFWMPSLVILAFLESQNYLRSIYKFQIIQPILGIILYIVFMKILGQNGLGYAIISLQALSFILLFLLGWKKKPISS